MPRARRDRAGSNRNEGALAGPTPFAEANPLSPADAHRHPTPGAVARSPASCRRRRSVSPPFNADFAVYPLWPRFPFSRGSWCSHSRGVSPRRQHPRLTPSSSPSRTRDAAPLQPQAGGPAPRERCTRSARATPPRVASVAVAVSTPWAWDSGSGVRGCGRSGRRRQAASASGA